MATIQGAKYSSNGYFEIVYEGETHPRVGMMSISTIGTPNVIICGPVGVGKSHLITAFVVEIMKRYLIHVKFIGSAKLLHEIRATYSAEKEYDAEELMDEYSKAPILVIDDLGVEKPSDWVRETLYLIVDNRYNALLPTYITSNRSPKQLAAKLDDRLVSRLLQGAIVLKLEGEDRRLIAPTHTTEVIKSNG